MTAQDQERTECDGHSPQDIGDGHEGPAGEFVSERAGRQSKDEPRDTVSRHHARDCQGEACPQSPEGAAELLPPGAVFRPTTNPHRTFASVLTTSLPYPP